ncbi:uncharacterized protein BHQ10_007939 [Talaromyces amestolkiae]|uniref:Uncharacterized protein n=1 Tax=Talaromyces amestolkiae TaxID=1196081 RepID=A0A364L7Y1_TALAM|nr:uncharacterized protein BHQ10_007939 [Talaromyces amestolkiae]RAO71927.1 hypothetical protein BHQ10_007939 [Talaromyces amestolkiae]
MGESISLLLVMMSPYTYLSDSFYPKLSNLLDSILQGPNICASNAIRKLLAIFEQDKCRHGSYTKIPRDLLLLINVYLEKAHICIGFAEFADFGSNSFARTAPCGEEVDNNGTGGG